MIKKLFFGLLSILAVNVQAQVPAFPGAEGFGALSVGGRGGKIYHVTNLDNDGPGSFRDAVSQPERMVVFDVAGVIRIQDRVNVASNITIAGQTAPGEGIVVYGNAVSFSRDSNIIARYIRFRGSIDMPRGACTVYIDSAKNVILDHVSIEWGRWDNLHIKGSSDVTVQHCLIGEAIDPQRFGALLERPERLTVHHCLWMDNQSRNPKAKAGIEYINNVIYNWGGSGLVGGHSSLHYHQDVINNYFIAGPNSSEHFISMFTATDHVYPQGNMLDTNKDGQLNGAPVTSGHFSGIGATIEPQRQHNPLVPVTIEEATSAFKYVFATAGASIKRDAVDARLISYVKSLGKRGMIYRTEAEAGGQPQLKSGKLQKDADKDGIPDKWEKMHGLNANDPSDGNTYKLDKQYTNLEVYLNGIKAAS